jgi:hypothetical protein
MNLTATSTEPSSARRFTHHDRLGLLVLGHVPDLLEQNLGIHELQTGKEAKGDL